MPADRDFFCWKLKFRPFFCLISAHKSVIMFKSPTIKVAVGAGVITVGALAVSYALNGRKKKPTKIIEMVSKICST